MIRFRRKVWVDMRALFDLERVVPPQSAAVRARALARARMALAVPCATDPGSMPVLFAVPLRRRIVAFALGFLVSASVGAAAYEIRARLAPVAKVGAHRSDVASAPAPLAVTAVSPSVPEDDSRIVLAGRIARPKLSRGDTAIAELRLLQQARDAMDRGDFGAALRPINEHARKFPNGRLSEEREALHVKALAEVGRNEEARQAASAFRARFPRSVLSPAVGQIPDSIK